MFEHFETCSTQERAEIARNLKKLYNWFYKDENEKFLAMREAKGPAAEEAHMNYIASVNRLRAIQAVFGELGIEFDGLYNL